MKLEKNWTEGSYLEFQKELLQLEDPTYKEFNFKIIFTNYEKIGIRVPLLKELAKKIGKEDAISFLKVVKNTYYEEVLLEGFVISTIKDIDTALPYFDSYIKKIDNWALCDCVISSMKIVKSNRKVFFRKIKQYLKSKKEYIVRVGLVLLLCYYIDDEYIDSIFSLCNHVKIDTYYVNMANAWLISECFLKYKKKTLDFLKENELNKFTQNKAISKIRDSYRASDFDKLTVLEYKK